MATIVTNVATGKLATIVAASQIAINVGKNSGVQMGDKVTLVRLIEIKDPDSGELLGTVSLPKLALSVVLVGEKYSVATVTDRVPVKPSLGSAVMPRSSTPLKTVTEDPLVGYLDGSVVSVKIGESARVTRESDQSDESSS